MARPVVAIIGRPNVGKSTLVNRLCRSREAIVHDEPGVTRDRTYQDGYWGDREFKVVDTGGLVFDDDSEFLPEIREQANLAMAEACVALVIVDGQQGMTAADESIAEWLRTQNCPTLLAVNKCESPDQGLAMAAEFWSLGLGEPHPISAIHGAGTGDLLDQLGGRKEGVVLARQVLDDLLVLVELLEVVLGQGVQADLACALAVLLSTEQADLEASLGRVG